VIDLSDGSCRTTDPEIFFQDEVTAKMICRECPVKEPCLDWALTHNESGVWGGTTALERWRMRNPRTRKVTPPPMVGGHGVARYRRGCRCDVCRAGNAELQRRYQATNKKRTHCLECGATLSGRGRHKYCSIRCRRQYEERATRRTA
jgi:WhiB family redox-sensing transcriptional regulator